MALLTPLANAALSLAPIFSAVADQIKIPSGIPWEWLILHVFDFVGNYGWRIVLFTVLLKLVLMPLDIYQRVKMRKNQKITEKLKPEMEKLQKVYGSDKQTLQQKQMELNKREGYSYFSACLPMILTLVIFIWLWQSLNSVSQFMNMKQYVEWYDVYKATEQVVYLNDRADGNTGNTYGIDYYTVYLDPGYDKDDAEIIKDVNALFGVKEGETPDDETLVKIDEEVALRIARRDSVRESRPLKAAEYIAFYNAADAGYKESHFDPDAVRRSVQAQYERPAENADPDRKYWEDMTADEREEAVMKAVVDSIIGGIEREAEERGSQAVFDFYHDEKLTNREGFLWIKNIWAADVPWTKPINDYSTFVSNAGDYAKKAGKLGIAKADFDALKGAAMYNKVTKKLRSDKSNNYNGYLVLPILTIGLSFLSYFITSRQQKKAGQVNETGQMAGSMKMMMFIMPLMMGFFAFMYTSMFTIYMVTNSLTTILINLGSTGVLELIDRQKSGRGGTAMRYGRPDPNAGKKGRSKNSDQPIKYGRPDPNAPGTNDTNKRR